MLKKVVSIVILLISTFWAMAQEMSFITQPAATKVGIEDPFEVRYIIENAGSVKEFSLPNMVDFQVMGPPSKNSYFNISNGQRSSGLELTYVFKPKRKGKCTIPGGVAIVGNGRQIKSNPVVIEVVSGSVARRSSRNSRDPFGDSGMFDDPFGDDIFEALQKEHEEILEQMQQMQKQLNSAFTPQSLPQRSMQDKTDPEHINDNIFIKVEVDKKTANVGEQITASYKLYTRIAVHMNITKIPALVGFWSQDFKIPFPPEPTNEMVNGKMYNVYELKRSALFPTQTGLLELDPAEAQSTERLDNGQPIIVQSKPLKINVVELPNALKPEHFDGAVGQFDMESNIDKTELTTDDVATITLRVSGTGNLKLIGPPKINFPEGLDRYEPKIHDTITNRNDIIAGYKTFTYSFNPKNPGSYTIPPAEFAYFDAVEKVYKKLTSPSYVIHVKQGNQQENTVSNNLPNDIHDILASSNGLTKTSSYLLPKSPLFWGGFGIPTLAYLLLLGYKKREHKLQSNTIMFKSKKANKIALKRLQQAEVFLKETAQGPFYEETARAVWLYLSDKLNIPLSGLSKEVAAKKMKDQKIPDELQLELFRITDDCEVALYTPDKGTMRMHQTYHDAFKLIGKMEEHLS